MKKMMKNVFMALGFVALLLVGETTVASAEGKYYQNISFSGANNTNVYKHTIEGMKDESGNLATTYHVVDDIESASFKLKMKSKSKPIGGFFLGNSAPYRPTLYVIKCDDGKKDCVNPKAIKIEDRAGDDAITNQFRKDGYELYIDDSKFSSDEVIDGLTDISGLNVSKLHSDYGCGNKTYFLVVRTVAIVSSFGQSKVQDEFYEVFRIVNAKEVGGNMTIKQTKNSDGSIKVKIVSPASITNNVKFFGTKTVLSADPKNEAEFDTAASVATVKYAPKEALENAKRPQLAENVDEPTRSGYVYVLEFNIEPEDENEFYYVYADDNLGHGVAKNVSVPGSENEDSHKPVVPVNPNAKDNTFGKVILYILLSVLVLAAVLLIIQRIIDQRRKMY